MKSSLIRIVLLIMASSLAAGVGFGQDLGSSNKLFKKPKPAAKKPAPVKKSSAAKTSAPKAPKSAKPSASTTKKARPSKAQPKATAKAPAKNSTGTSTAETGKKTAPAGRPAPAGTDRFTEFRDPRPKVVITPRKNETSSPAASTISETRYEDLIDTGNQARDDRNYTAAERAYKAARSARPRDARAVYGLGNLYSDQFRWADAETAYRSAIQIEPTNAYAHIALSYVLTQPIPAPDLADRYEEAERIAKRAIQLAPGNALAFDQLGVALELRGLIGAETENAYRRAIQIAPSFAPAHAHLGRLLRRRGLNKEADASYETAISRSTDVPTLILVAEVMQSEQQHSKSEELLKNALKDDPRNPAGLLLLGRALNAQAKYAEAERVLLSSLSVSPNGYTAFSLLGSVYLRQRQFDRAERSLLEALRAVSPLEKRGLSQQFENVGDGFLKGGSRRDAERTYRQAIALDPENQGLVTKLSRSQRGS